MPRIDGSCVPRDAPGCRAELFPSGALRRFAYYEGGRCLDCLDLAEDRPWGQRRGPIAGEEYDAGTLRPLGPFAGSGPSRRAGESFTEWARRQIDEIAARGRG